MPTPRQVSSGNWYLQLRLGGERINVTEKTERECIERARAIKAGLIEVERTPEDEKTVGEVIDKYIEDAEPQASPSTIDGYLRKRKKNLQSLMPLKVSEMTASAVQQAINEDAKKYAGKTICNAWGLVSAATGVRYSKEEIKLPSKRAKKTPPVYSSDDLARLLFALRQIGGEVECAGLLALWLSLRRSEIKGLKWSDIHSDSISIRTAMVYDKNHKLVEKETKTDVSERIILCNQYVLDRINALPRVNEYVFQKSTSSFWEGITKACDMAGIEHGYLHGLRHTNASIMALQKVDAKYAMKRGGWSSESTYRKIYQQVMSEGDVDTANVIDDYFLRLMDAILPEGSKDPETPEGSNEQEEPSEQEESGKC